MQESNLLYGTDGNTIFETKWFTTKTDRKIIKSTN